MIKLRKIKCNTFSKNLGQNWLLKPKWHIPFKKSYLYLSSMECFMYFSDARLISLGYINLFWKIYFIVVATHFLSFLVHFSPYCWIIDGNWNTVFQKKLRIWDDIKHHIYMIRPGGIVGTLETRLHSYLENSLPFPNM